MHLIQQIGSYAGLAAIPGLAVLAALYFSQARDVRRLRDWAGRAPERAAEQAVGGRVTAAPQAQPAAAAKPAATTPAVPGTAAAKPAAATPAAASAAGAKPATAAGATAGKAATPAGAAAAAGAGAAASGGGSATGTVARPGPPAVGATRPAAGVASGVRRPAPRVPSQTSILTPTSPPHEPWYRRAAARLPAGRYIALIVAGILVLGGGAAYALTQVGGDSGSPSKPAASRASSSKSSSGSSKKSDKTTSATISPSSVTVTVVNGTSTPNLARDTATKLSGFGFQIGNKVTGTGTLAAAESVVEYKPGAEDEARLVADKLNINQKQPADGDALAQAGIANVIVVLGADQAPGG